MTTTTTTTTTMMMMMMIASRLTRQVEASSINVRRPFEKFVDWRQCAAVMQWEAVTVMPSCSGGGNVVVA
jgi:hypothetical protein